MVKFLEKITLILDNLYTTIKKIEILLLKSSDPVHAVPIDAPVILGEKFKCSYLCITVEKQRSRSLCAFWREKYFWHFDSLVS